MKLDEADEGLRDNHESRENVSRTLCGLVARENLNGTKTAHSLKTRLNVTIKKGAKILSTTDSSSWPTIQLEFLSMIGSLTAFALTRTEAHCRLRHDCLTSDTVSVTLMTPGSENQ